MALPARAPVSLDHFVPLVRTLAARLSREHFDDLVQEGLIALQRALERDRKLASSFALVRTVISRAQWRALMRWARNPCFEGEPISPQRALDAEHDELAFYYMALERRLGSDARRIAENLVEPSEPGVVAAAFDEDLSEPDRIRRRITRRHVRLGLGLRRSQWNGLLREIRSFTAEWLQAR